MSRDGPEARLDELSRILALPPEHRLLYVGRDLEDDAEDVHGPTDVVLQIYHHASCRLFFHSLMLNFHYLGTKRRISRLFVEHYGWQKSYEAPL